MSGYYSRWNAWLFPELRRFPDEQSRHAAGVEFQRKIGILNWRIAALLPLAIGFGVLTPFLVPHLRAWLPLPSPTASVILGGGLIGLVQGAVFATFINWSYRKPMQRFLREKLNTLGVPTCVGCGYDTRSLAEPRCPECGRPFAPAS